jgi:DNA-binding Lrp family transcriptional regulator
MVDDLDATILKILRKKGPSSSSEIASSLGLSRQAAHARLKKLLDRSAVIREGRARATRYRLPELRWEERFPLHGLAEDRVFDQLARELPPLQALDGQALSLLAYVVTELVNNAIDHSAGTAVWVRVRVVGAELALEIEDDGVGAFAHVRRTLGLPNDLAAIQEISKGKTTTAPDRHTGEGLFFCSKAVDLFRLESGTLAWIVDNDRADMAVAELGSSREGTLARATIDLDDVRNLAELFDEYTEDYEFSKTRTVIKLFTIGVRFISRSEAKRLVHGLEKFREVVLDFAGVETVGQGFADEVFRVWARSHPDITLTPVHMSDPVAYMVERARRAG